MDFLKKLFGGARTSGEQAQEALWLYVQCDKCGTPLAVRIDPRHEISTDYETGGRYLRKEMMDSTCFQLMYATLRFDSAGNITEQSIEHGKFLSKAEYEALKARPN